MFWKIIATLILAALIKKGLLGILLSYNFLMDGDLARYSPILKERFPSGFFILSDTLNLTANLLIFIWSALYIAAMWLDGIISPTPLVVLSVAGISVSLQAIPMNRKIKTELYDSVTKFKHISDLPDDVREHSTAFDIMGRTAAELRHTDSSSPGTIQKVIATVKDLGCRGVYDNENKE